MDVVVIDAVSVGCVDVVNIKMKKLVLQLNVGELTQGCWSVVVAAVVWGMVGRRLL